MVRLESGCPLIVNTAVHVYVPAGVPAATCATAPSKRTEAPLDTGFAGTCAPSESVTPSWSHDVEGFSVTGRFWSPLVIAAATWSLETPC